MDVHWTGRAVPAEAVRLLERHGFRVVTGVAAASTKVAQGRLVLSLPLDVGPNHEDSTDATSRATEAATERRRRGQRTGPRPTKPRRETAQRIADLRAADDKLSLRKIAATLNDEGVRSPNGATWRATTVKRAIDAGVTETRIVLRRVGKLLDAVQTRGAVTEPELAALGSKYGFHHHRLLRAFEAQVGAPYVGRFVPALDRVPNGFVVSNKGAELLRIWHRSEDLDDRIEEVLRRLGRAGNAPIDDGHLARECEEQGVNPDELSDRFVIQGVDGWTLTPEARDVARTWRRVVDDDPRERLDIDFWPEPHEERRLAPTWDWEDDPLVTMPSPPERTAGTSETMPDAGGPTRD